MFSNAFSQNKSVPYRVGNVFGISNEKGKIIIKPQFDIIEVSTYDTFYFTCFNFNQGITTSSLIYNNKIIINNKDYNNYFGENELFTAKKYFVNPKKSNYSDDKVKAIVHLYNKDGKAIISEDCNFIAVLENSDELKISNEILVYYENASKKYSLFLYNKKLKKITNYYFENSEFLEIDNNQNYDYTNKSITFTYVDKNKKGKKLSLLQESKGVTKVSEVDFEVKYKADSNREHFDNVAVPYFDDKNKKPILTSNDSIIDIIRNVEIDREFYFNPKKIEKIKIETEKLSLDWSYIIKKNDKVGLKLTRDNKIIIPIEYDEIFKTELGGLNSCYLVKKNNKFGAQIYAYNVENRFKIEPVFNNMFLISDLNYFGEKNPLLKVYDENGLFFCYAKKDGTLFAK